MTGDSIACCGDDVDVDSTSPIVCEGGESSSCTRQIDSTSTILVWKGLWIDGSMYAVGDGVPDQYNSQYVCEASHIAGQATKPGVGVDWTTYWTRISQMTCVATTGATYYSRETYDCGSGYDYGAVVDEEVFVKVEDRIDDHMRCPADGTAFIVSDLVSPVDATAAIVCIDSTTCGIAVSDGTTPINFEYWQSSGFRDFDGVPSTSYPVYVQDGTTLVLIGYGPEPGSEGTFDCTHGFDLVHITSEYIPFVGSLQQENLDYILQENLYRIRL